MRRCGPATTVPVGLLALVLVLLGVSAVAALEPTFGWASMLEESQDLLYDASPLSSDSVLPELSYVRPDWTTRNRSLGMCSMYGTCPGDPLNRVINCPDNVPPVMPTTFNTTICPRFLGGPVCCDSDQYNALASRVNQASAILERCPACYASFLEFFCELTCSPNQASFLTVQDVTVVSETVSANGTILSETLAVNSTMYYVATEYAEKLYNSCRDVKSAATGNPIMQLIFQSTNYEEFLAFLGSPGTTQEKSPIQIEYTFTSMSDNESMTLVDNLHSCNDSDTTYTCSCNDCRWCNGPQCVAHVVEPEKQLVLGGSFLDPLNIGLILAAFSYLAVLLALWAVRAVKRRMPPAHVRASDEAADSIRFGRRLARPSLLFAGGVGLLVLIGVTWIFWGRKDLPTESDQEDTVYFLDSYWTHALLGGVVTIFVVMISTLLLATCCTSGLGGVRFSAVAGEEEDSDESAGPSKSDSSASASPEYIKRRVSDVTSDEPNEFDEQDDDDDVDGGARRRQQMSCADRFFTSLGHVVSTHPWKVLVLAVVVTAACGVGIIHIELETDPIKLWVPPDSQVLSDKNQFDRTFGAFYRTEQVIWLLDETSPSNANSTNPVLTTNSLLDPAILRAIYAAELRIQNLTAEYDGQPVTWPELCNRPTNQGCVRMSVTGYFDNALPSNQFTNTSTSIDIVRAWVSQCINEPVFSACRSDIGAPMFPKVVFGGFDFEAEDFINATALITTYLLNNEPDTLDLSEAWEKVYLDEVRAIQAEFIRDGIPLTLHYSAERSVQDELARSSSADIPTIAISYGVMFIYIGLALGRLWPIDRRFLVHTKCTLAFTAILLVLFSLTISVGIVCSLGVKMTPIISEVIPFLVLAIGIDNVFILLHTFQRQDRRKYPSIETRIKRTLREVGTSITLASMSEAVAFILGGQTKMPAVRAFAFYSFAAIVADYFLQITAFVAVIVLDARRTESGRIDCCPCARIDDDIDGGEGNNYSERLRRGVREEEYEYEYAEATESKASPKEINSPLKPSKAPQPPAEPESTPSATFVPAPLNEGLLQRLIRQHYVPFVLHRVTKMCVLMAFGLVLLFFLGYGIHNVQVGLDQKYVVPKDSYLQDYFYDLSYVFAVGPPVYFVVNPSNLTDYKYPVDQNRICSQSGCSDTSVQAIIFNQVCDPSALIAQGPSSWIDDYITWLKIRAPCCRVWKVRYGHKYAKGDYCPVQFSDDFCEMCLQPSDFITYNNVTRPPPEAFTKYLTMYLDKSECTTECGSCGWGHNADVIWDPTVNRTGATRYMAYHSPLRNQEAFVDALKSGRRINQMIIDDQHLDAYVYSVVYPFFEQYLTIVDVCIFITGLGMVGIFVLSMAIIRNVWAAAQIVVTILMILGDLLGVMALWNISINALSALNFVMAIGISVEFCIHLTVSFMHTSGSRDYRIASALVNVGSSIVSGITLTKASGVIVLATASSEVFEIYYFRMYFTIVILGFLHGLMFLPVLLSLVGPPSLLRRRKGWSSFFSLTDDHTDAASEPLTVAVTSPREVATMHLTPNEHDLQQKGTGETPRSSHVVTRVHEEAKFQAYAPFK